MSAKKKMIFESTFHQYTSVGIIGEGGAGRIFHTTNESGDPYAVKLLDPQKATKNKVKRFENEIRFCSRFKHPHIIYVLDYGLFNTDSYSSPFYVMPLYHGSLRDLIKSGITQEKILVYFDQILSGVEAAHIKDVIHRDIKPENILYDQQKDALLIGDFGIAHFEEEDLYTAVQTKDSDRLANFKYAAPEQRERGQDVDHQADIYALGLILNEMFTSRIPFGNRYKLIGTVNSKYEYLDKIVSDMICQSPDDRPNSIEKVKNILIGYRSEFITRQKLNELENTVIPSTSIDDDPLIADPLRLVDVDWNNGVLTLIFSQVITRNWIHALQNMGGHRSTLGKGPESFSFQENFATISSRAEEAQDIVDYFKGWIPKANRVYKQRVENARRENERRQREKLEKEIELQRTRERVLKKLKI